MRRGVPVPRPWRRRVSGTLLVIVTCGGLVYIPYVPEWTWHVFGSVHFDYGRPLSLLPGAALLALLAPRVGYRRRDALTVLALLPGIWLAWTVGTRLGQLPYRDWAPRADATPFPGRWGRRAALVGAAVHHYRRRRSARRPGADVEVHDPVAEPVAVEVAVRDEPPLRQAGAVLDEGQ
jgi:hypothetical protein